MFKKYLCFALVLVGVLSNNALSDQSGALDISNVYWADDVFFTDGRELIDDSDKLVLSGSGNAIFETDGGMVKGSSFQAMFSLESYPAPAKDNAFYELLPNVPIETNKIRYVCYDSYARVIELRVYEPGMPEYPSILSDSKDVGYMENFAASAKLNASSHYGGFTPDFAVDGVVSNTSRWVSGEDVPHILEVDFLKKRTVGCVQVLTGLMSVNQITSIAQNFKIQYYKDGKWVDLDGIRQNQAPGRLGLISAYSSKGYYCLIHQKKPPMWSIRHIENSGDEVVLASSDDLPDMMEGNKYILSAVNTGDRLSFYLNGDILIAAEIDEAIAGNFAVQSLSESNKIAISSVEIKQINLEKNSLLENVSISTAGGEKLKFKFSPSHFQYNIQLPRRDIDIVDISAQKCFDGQKIYIDGVEANRRNVRLNQSKPQKVKVEAAPPKGSKSVYEFVIQPIPISDDLKLAFVDDFNATAIDDNWYYRIGKRWNSIQTKDNVFTEDGKLKIKLSLDQQGRYLTGGVISRELFGYGYYETSAKLFDGTGWHSAFWLMGYNPPQGHTKGYCGPKDNQINEIDCFESTSPNSFSSNLHYYQPNMIVGAQGYSADVASQFNTFAWEWTPTKVRFFFNSKMIREVDYPPPHGLQNVWLSCVAHDNSSVDNLPGEIVFEYFKFYTKDYGTAVLPKATVLDTDSPEYFEIGQWSDGEYAVSHRYDKSTRHSNTENSRAGWVFKAEQAGSYEVFVWNSYNWIYVPVVSYDFDLCVNGEKTIASFNPIKHGQKWVSLGVYRLDEGECEVSITADEDYPVSLDALMYLRTE